MRKPVPQPETILGFIKARDDGVAVASPVPYASQLHLTPDIQPCQHLITQFVTGWTLFLPPNQQCQSTEGNVVSPDTMCTLANQQTSIAFDKNSSLLSQ